jgi:hypothetical protein
MRVPKKVSKIPHPPQGKEGFMDPESGKISTRNFEIEATRRIEGTCVYQP